MESMPDNEYDIHGDRAGLDTIRWALGDVRACACRECWERREVWRWVRILLGAIERERPGVTPREIADGLWVFLTKPGRRPLRLRSPERGRWQATHHLREYAAREGWNVGQLYEIVLRGVAQNR
jgi:hypothetical protein